eukprot:gene28063-31166_t
MNMKMLKTLFAIDFDLHSIAVTGADEVTARRAMGMGMWLLPWKPSLNFTGTTHYKVDPDSGTILAHVDIWDAIKHNRFLSLEGLQHVMKMFIDVQMTPDIETHKHAVLKKYRDYELRQYDNYLVAESTMPPGSGPASGTGFTELTNYISGSNKEVVKMAMTAPVVSIVPPGSQESSVMHFVMESRFTDMTQLPIHSTLSRPSDQLELDTRHSSMANGSMLLPDYDSLSVEELKAEIGNLTKASDWVASQTTRDARRLLAYNSFLHHHCFCCDFFEQVPSPRDVKLLRFQLTDAHSTKKT